MKVHHPDVGGDPQMAKAIEEAYRELSSKPQHFRPLPATSSAVPALKDQQRYLEIQILELKLNQAYNCPPECAFYQRNCRYKQALAFGSGELKTLHASTLYLLVSNQTDFSQRFDCCNGRGVLVDQTGDFYPCQRVCTWQHSPRHKEAGVELFPATKANVQLWFPQLLPGRRPIRFVYKHKVIISGRTGDRLDEELIELPLC